MRRVLFIICTLYAYSSAAQLSTPKYSNEFLSIGVGARALGMGNSVVSHVGDGTAAYWNPSGLLNIKDKYEATLMHSEYFAGIASYDFIGLAMPVDTLSHIALSVIRFGIDDIPDTRFLYDANGAINYDNIRFFSAADYAFMFSYARKIPALGGLGVGANFKVVHRKVGDFAHAWGFGLDIGAQKKMGRWQFGLMLRDITGTFNAWSHNAELVEDVYALTGNEIPVSSLEVTLPRAILAISHHFQLMDQLGLLASADLEMTFDGKRNVAIKSDLASISPMLGLELDYGQVAFLRLGAGKFQQIKDFNNTTITSWQPNFGIGVKLKSFRMDYAMTDFSDNAATLYSHVFSLAMGINDKK
ncbi:MAG: PorV/PorQ family protein [Cyclobacteriaceae bacterium]|nr:PorV/PorQ family protein [Cyclobacteriaceae bacterium]